jgi:alkanesulfonate monooxygenase SsuD/methylene tetrahydromethanopterin reductase-like flavin-dependent oxidoreductase (luciferase family)
MHYGLDVINVGAYADPRTVAEVARLAEQSGWEGLFMWDHLGYVWDGPAGDPWICLAAAASASERLRLGTHVTPLPRRRPQDVALQCVTLDHLSEGRMTLGAGLGGVEDELVCFGETVDAGVRGAMLDEALDVITALWSGGPMDHAGTHYTARGCRLAPAPVQQPRIPIWVGGLSAPALRRAARWDGWTAGLMVNERGEPTRTPAELAADVARIRAARRGDATFDVIVAGYSEAGGDVREWEAAGATWWLDGINGLRGTLDALMARIAAGPPRAAVATAQDGL